MKKLLLVFVVSMLWGCATYKMYEGAPRKSEEVTKISGMSGLNPINNFQGTMVCAVDKITLDPCQTDIELLPGKHTLLLKSTDLGMDDGETKVTKIFTPGSKYVIGVMFDSNVHHLPVLMEEHR